MSAQDNLHPEQFEPLYHGTPHELPVGAEITPPSARGMTSRRSSSDPDYSYASRTMMGARIHSWSADLGGGKPGHVYEVHPSGPTEPDPGDPRDFIVRTRQPMKITRKVPEGEIDDEWMAEQKRRREAHDAAHPEEAAASRGQVVRLDARTGQVTRQREAG